MEKIPQLSVVSWIKIFGVVLIMILPVLLLALVNFRSTKNILTNDIMSKQQTLAVLGAQTMGREFNRLLSVGSSFATRDQLQTLVEEGEWEKAANVFQYVQKDFPEIDHIYITDVSGVVRAAIAANPVLSGSQSFSGKSWFKAVLGDKKPHISEIYRRENESQDQIIDFAIPIRNTVGEVSGILVLQVKADIVVKWIEKLSIESVGGIFIVDLNNNIIKTQYQGREANFNTQLIPFIISELLYQKTAGIKIIYNSASKSDNLIAYAPVQEFGWSVMVVRDVTDAFGLRDRALRIFAIVSVVAVLAALIGIIMFMYAFQLQRRANLVITLENKTISNKVREQTVVLREQLLKIEDAKVKLETLLSSIGEGVIAIDKDGKIIFVNPIVISWLKLDLSKIEGKKLVTLIDVQDKDGKRLPSKDNPFESVLETKKPIFFSVSSPIYLGRINTTPLVVALAITPILIRGQFIGAIAVFSDVQKEVAVDRAKSEFVSFAAHQLRTPLSTISWYTEMLLGGDVGALNKEQKELLEEVDKGKQRMVDLVNILLNLSRLELGTFKVDLEPTDAVELIKQAVMDVSKNAANKQIQITESYEKIPTIMLDPRLTRIIFDNFLSNAVKYTLDGGKIFVSIAHSDNKGNDASILITVRDTGVGIPQAAQEKIFTKSFRADNAIMQDPSGFGFGLYIVKTILETTGGRVWFTSKENVGTTFFVELPLTGMKQKSGSKQLEV